MTEPRIVTTSEAANIDWEHAWGTDIAFRLADTVATEDARIRAAVIKALDELAGEWEDERVMKVRHISERAREYERGRAL